jgi:hypothetical protein
MWVWIWVHPRHWQRRSGNTPPPNPDIRPNPSFEWAALRAARLVDLDDTDAGLFQVEYLRPNGGRDLTAGLRPRLVSAHEGPLQNGHRTGQHALTGFFVSDWL